MRPHGEHWPKLDENKTSKLGRLLNYVRKRRPRVCGDANLDEKVKIGWKAHPLKIGRVLKLDANRDLEEWVHTKLRPQRWPHGEHWPENKTSKLGRIPNWMIERDLEFVHEDKNMDGKRDLEWQMDEERQNWMIIGPREVASWGVPAPPHVLVPKGIRWTKSMPFMQPAHLIT